MVGTEQHWPCWGGGLREVGAVGANGGTVSLLALEGQSPGCSTKNSENLKRVINFFN